MSFQTWLDSVGRRLKRWWERLSFPPKPSDFFLLFSEDLMADGTFKAVVVIPALRQDEQEYIPVITSRILSYSIDGGPGVDVSIALDKANFSIAGIPDESTLLVGLANVASDGRLSDRTDRQFTAPDITPTPPAPVPDPDGVSVTFEEE